VVTLQVFIIGIVLLRLFWQHVVKYLLQGYLVITAFIVLVELLRYIKVSYSPFALKRKPVDLVYSMLGSGFR
jgi:hypothetical protein